MFLEIINQSDSHKNPGQNINFDSLNCGNFMDSFLIISATFHRNLNYPDEGLLEVDLTNDGHALIGDFYLYISLEKRSDTEFEKTIPRTLEIRKKVQKITRGQCLIFTLLIEPNQLKESNIISVWAQANKRTYLNSKLCVEIPL
jgi:hypothetical protein